MARAVKGRGVKQATEGTAQERGQVISYDIYLAVFVFLLIFTGMYVVWQDTLRGMEEQRLLLQTKASTASVADLLVKTPGIPYNWEVSLSPEVFGLAGQDLVLSEAKLSALKDNFDYGSFRDVMGLGGYEYYMDLVQDGVREWEYGQLDVASGEISKEYPERRIKYGVTRIVEYQGTPAVFRFYLYR